MAASALAMLCAATFGTVPNNIQAQAPSSQLDLRTTDAGAALSRAMSRLAENPRDVDALLTAGEAALKLDDPRSAIGFFGRADDLSPKNGRAKAGLGRSMLQLDQVVDGLRLMEEAASLGYSDAALYADRGLARDLSGNQAGAQQDYQAALQIDPKNELIIRRYAVSLGISGQVEVADAKLKPLLYNSDRAAWRDRAFILAMNGHTKEALDITSRMMPRPLADAIAPYIERMGMLKPGQKAAAVHMGQFPPGLVNMRVTSTAVPVQAAAPVAPATDTRKSPKGKRAVKADQPVRVAQQDQPASTASSRSARQSETRQHGQQQAPQPTSRQIQPVQRTSAQPMVQPTPSRSAATSSRAQTAPREPAAAARSSAVEPALRAVQGPPTPADLRPAQAVAESPPAQPQPIATVASASSASQQSPRSLADIMAELKVPDNEQRSSVAAVNLADVAALQAARRKADQAAARAAAKKKAEDDAKAKAKAAAEAEKKRLAANPARYWLQIGIGRNKSALGFTLKAMKKEHSAIGKYDGWSAAWGATNRLVVGPFSNLDKAKASAAELKKSGSDAFVWRSEAGEELERVGS
jgi:Flp pilus assembly protein TadD